MSWDTALITSVVAGAGAQLIGAKVNANAGMQAANVAKAGADENKKLVQLQAGQEENDRREQARR